MCECVSVHGCQCEWGVGVEWEECFYFIKIIFCMFYTGVFMCIIYLSFRSSDGGGEGDFCEMWLGISIFLLCSVKAWLIANWLWNCEMQIGCELWNCDNIILYDLWCRNKMDKKLSTIYLYLKTEIH